jgi:hypothetical protein
MGNIDVKTMGIGIGLLILALLYYSLNNLWRDSSSKAMATTQMAETS